MRDRTHPLSGLFARRYVIEGEIGRGSTAVVYAANDEQTGQQVAIKLLRTELAHSLAEGRFATEVRRHQQLKHENILPVLDFGDEGGRLFCVLPLMGEGTLRTRLQREHQLSVADALTIARSVALALGHAHGHGLVHRDVKPENILFSNGAMYLADFGIARDLLHPPGETSTTTGVVRGTGPYMSPEQAAGEKDYDGRSDLYSLGCVLYEMISGMQPFLGPTTQSVIAQRLIHSPPAMGIYRYGVADEVEELVGRAMALSPVDRFETAQQMADALAEMLANLNTPRSTPALTPTASRTPTPSRTLSAGRRATPASASDTTPPAPRSRIWVGPAIGLLALAAASALALRIKQAPRPLSAAATAELPAEDPRRIAVLYLDDLSPDSVPPYVVDGITEDLIDQLASVRALHVISPSGVRSLRGSTISLDSIGRRLQVGTVVSGSVARSGNTLRVNVRLSDAKTNQLLQTIPIEMRWTDVFALQDTLADRVAFALRQRLGDEVALRAYRAGTASFAAWQAVQLGREVVRQAQTAATLRADPSAPLLFLRADSIYASAELLDPRWTYPTLRRGRLALALSFGSPLPPTAGDTARYRTMSRVEQRTLWVTQAVALANRALAKTPNLPTALALRADANFALLGLVPTERDSLARAAERDARAALDARPDLVTAWSTLSKLAMRDGRFDDAAAAARTSFESDAYHEAKATVSNGFFASLAAGQFAEARRWCDFGRTHYVGDPRFAECELTYLGWTGNTRKDVDSAWHQFTVIEQRDTLHMLAATRGYRQTMVAAVLARAGLPDSARTLLDAASARPPGDTTVQAPTLEDAYVRLLLGERDRALRALTELLRTRPDDRPFVRAHAWFKPLRNDPAFAALVR